MRSLPILLSFSRSIPSGVIGKCCLLTNSYNNNNTSPLNNFLSLTYSQIRSSSLLNKGLLANSSFPNFDAVFIPLFCITVQVYLKSSQGDLGEAGYAMLFQLMNNLDLPTVVPLN